MKTSFPQTITKKGVSITIRRITKGRYQSYRVEYMSQGERKLVWRADYADAKKTAEDAITAISNGDNGALALRDNDRHVYERARDVLLPAGIKLDVAARDYAESVSLLGGRASVVEACRDWLKRHDVRLPKKTVADATDDCIASAKTDGKSRRRIQQLEAVFNRMKDDLNIQVTEITPSIVSQWLSGLPLSERTRRNYRDAAGYFNRWCVMRGYLTNGTDWLEGVQNYSARKLSEIEIYTPEEVAKLIEKANDDMLPFIVIQAFAGLRHAEVARLDWNEIELSDKPGDSFIEVRAAKSKTGERRLVPVQDNLKRWLELHRKARGPVCEYANTTKQLLKIAADAGVEWKHNGLRHSAISYRVAATADVPRVADESGNSAQIIRQHYLRRVKPAEAARWFSIGPTMEQGKIVQFKTANAQS